MSTTPVMRAIALAQTAFVYTGTAGCGSRAAVVPVATAPAPEAQSLMGQVPKEPLDETPITPVESAGASRAD
jgi:hypothetical protein